MPGFGVEPNLRLQSLGTLETLPSSVNVASPATPATIPATPGSKSDLAAAPTPKSLVKEFKDMSIAGTPPSEDSSVPVASPKPTVEQQEPKCPSVTPALLNTLVHMPPGPSNQTLKQTTPTSGTVVETLQDSQHVEGTTPQTQTIEVSDTNTVEGTLGATPAEAEGGGQEGKSMEAIPQTKQKEMTSTEASGSEGKGKTSDVIKAPESKTQQPADPAGNHKTDEAAANNGETPASSSQHQEEDPKAIYKDGSYWKFPDFKYNFALFVCEWPHVSCMLMCAFQASELCQTEQEGRVQSE